MAKTPLLITLLPSSGCDLARWILAHYGVEYRERPHAPIVHVFAMQRWNNGSAAYPVYVSADRNTKAAGCRPIAKLFEPSAAADKKLFPDPETEADLAKEVEELVDYTYLKVGDDVVNWSYWNLLKYRNVVWPSVTTKVPWYEVLTYILAFPLIRFAMYKALKLDQSVADKSLESIHEAFDKLDERLSDGRRYLFGERMTYADLATAASFAPMILAQGYHGMLPNHAKCQVFMQEIYAELRQRPTGLFIQRLYDEHRPAQLLQV